MKKKLQVALTLFMASFVFAMLLPSTVSVAAPKGAKAAGTYKDHYYAVFDLTSWSDAKAACKKMGGHLVTITSAAENKAVYKLVKKANFDSAAIGLHNAGTSDNPKWKWVTGEKVSYTCWQEGQPDFNWSGEEKYGGFLREATWNDYRNSDPVLNAYVCEWDYCLKLAETKINLDVNDSTYIDYVIKGSNSAKKQKVTFKSSNTSVVKVSSKGKLVAKKAGTATITCKVGSLSEKVKVTVYPGQVKNVSAVSKTKTSIKLTWKKQAGISKYEVYMYDADLEEYTKVKTVGGDFNVTTISGLKKNKTYSFKVRAYVKDGSKKVTGDFSKIAKIKTSK